MLVYVLSPARLEHSQAAFVLQHPIPSQTANIPWNWKIAKTLTITKLCYNQDP